ncbi:hypothetical protein Nepgr_019504 [Nepenthes gracilis]|uniref:Regulator of Vps4 activity in the MVB pathway protein n=1 Tax=Nepenthes gracilis TaxID=150966 RepID=A0AAD3SU53_NEPGR|nr:hypothetical protein Nepgr_019504 [Nepenthes gracilis]
MSKFWEAFGRSSFRAKCKSALRITMVRLAEIKMKRDAMQKYLKRDIYELLKINLDDNAYDRAEGLCIELNLSSCYDYVHECCRCISEHLKIMDKQRECPEECRGAAASLVHAAARFAGLPELRDLRHLFTKKYGNFFEHYVNKEFADKLKSNPPTMETKFQLMKDIAQEFSIEWDSTFLKQKLCSPTMPQQDQPANLGSSNGANDGYEFQRRRDDNAIEKEKLDHGDKHREAVKYTASTTNRSCYSSWETNEAVDDKYNQESRNKSKGSSYLRSSIEQNEYHRKSSAHGVVSIRTNEVTANSFGRKGRRECKGPNSIRSDIEENENHKKPFTNRIVPAPYVKPKAERHGTSTEDLMAQTTGSQYGDLLSRNKDVKNPMSESKGERNTDNGSVDEAKPKPRSVRSRFLTKASGLAEGSTSKMDHNAPEFSCGLQEDYNDHGFTDYSTKRSPRSPKDMGLSVSQQEAKGKQKSGLPLPPGRRRYLSVEQEMTPRIQSDRAVRHVHPKLPEYEDLVDQIEALRKLKI